MIAVTIATTCGYVAAKLVDSINSADDWIAVCKGNKKLPSRSVVTMPDRLASHPMCLDRTDRRTTIQLRSSVISLENDSVGPHLGGARWLLYKPQGALSHSPTRRRSVRIAQLLILLLTHESSYRTRIRHYCR